MGVPVFHSSVLRITVRSALNRRPRSASFYSSHSSDSWFVPSLSGLKTFAACEVHGRLKVQKRWSQKFIHRLRRFPQMSPVRASLQSVDRPVRHKTIEHRASELAGENSLRGAQIQNVCIT